MKKREFHTISSPIILASSVYIRKLSILNEYIDPNTPWFDTSVGRAVLERDIA
jgi:hypothetical protein